MGRTRQTITINDVIAINRHMIRHFGGIFFEGDDNLANRGALEYVLDELEASLYGSPIHPDIFSKAAALMCHIITRHIFHDGNKPTGLAACAFLLQLNGYHLRLNQAHYEPAEIAVNVATGKMTSEQICNWLKANTEPIS